MPGAQDIRDSITSLSYRLESVSHNRPALRKYLEQLKNKRQDFINQSQSLQVEINAIYDENREALRLKDLNVRRGRVVGRISLWLESVVISDNFERIKELAPNMQVIIVDHADIKEKRFQDSVVEKWWDGMKLVPIDWA